MNIRAEDIVDGNPKLILGLIWTIILHFQVSHPCAFCTAAADTDCALSCELIFRFGHRAPSRAQNSCIQISQSAVWLLTLSQQQPQRLSKSRVSLQNRE